MSFQEDGDDSVFVMWSRLTTSSSGSSLGSSSGPCGGRCQMRSVLSGQVGFVPTQYFTEYSQHPVDTATTASQQSLHPVQSSPGSLSAETLTALCNSLSVCLSLSCRQCFDNA